MTLIAGVLFVVAMVTVHSAAVSRQLADVLEALVTQAAVEILITFLKEIIYKQVKFTFQMILHQPVSSQFTISCLR